MRSAVTLWILRLRARAIRRLCSSYIFLDKQFNVLRAIFKRLCVYAVTHLTYRTAAKRQTRER